MKSRTHILLAFAIALVFASTVEAGIVRVNWEGRVTGLHFTPPPSVSIGDTISGSFTYDSSDPGSFFTADTRLYDMAGASYTIDLPGLPTEHGSGLQASIRNNAIAGLTVLDDITFFGIPQNVGDYGFTFAFRDFDATTLSDLSLPEASVFDPPFFANQEFQQLTISERSGPTTINGNVINAVLTSVSATDLSVAPVPEPASLATFALLGVVGVIGAHRKRRRQNAA